MVLAMDAAVACMTRDFAELQHKAWEVERRRYIPSQFEAARTGLEFLTVVAQHWEQLDESSRDVLRHLADVLDKASRPTWFERARGVMHVMVYAIRYGTDRMYQEVYELLDSCSKFRRTVLDAEERNNVQLQAMIGDAINSALTSESTVELTRGQVGEWIRSIPN